MEWYEKAFKFKSGKIGKAVEFKRTCTLNEYKPTGKIQNTFELIGVFPVSIHWGELTFEDGDKKLMSITLSIDSVEYIKGKEGV